MDSYHKNNNTKNEKQVILRNLEQDTHDGTGKPSCSRSLVKFCAYIVYIVVRYDTKLGVSVGVDVGVGVNVFFFGGRVALEYILHITSVGMKVCIE